MGTNLTIFSHICPRFEHTVRKRIMTEVQKLITFNSLLTRIQEIPSFKKPEVGLEQYPTSDELITELLLLASFTFNDVRDKRVIDLGCGTGKMGLGAAMLGATRVLLIDISKEAIMSGKMATQRNKQVRIDWLIQPVETLVTHTFHKSFDTVFMNAPFGSRRKGIDHCFLRKALDLAPVVYSIQSHFTPIPKSQENTERIIATKLFDRFIKIPKVFRFHQREKSWVKVRIYRYTS
ncbi:MAG: METTL5 family protein [Promethearchaeota archaeon]